LELAQDRDNEDTAATERWHDRPRLELAARLSTDSVQGLVPLTVVEIRKVLKNYRRSKSTLRM
jgi:hypothetical protein